MIEFTIITLILLTGILIYITKNLLNKVEKYEETVAEYEESILLFQKYYDEIKQAIQFSDEKLKIIDHKGTFKSDDEVGYFFTFLQELQILLNSFDYSKPHIKENETPNK